MKQSRMRGLFERYSHRRNSLEKLRRTNATQANMIDDYLEAVAKTFGERILPRRHCERMGLLTAIRPLPFIESLHDVSKP